MMAVILTMHLVQHKQKLVSEVKSQLFVLIGTPRLDNALNPTERWVSLEKKCVYSKRELQVDSRED